MAQENQDDETEGVKPKMEALQESLYCFF